MTNTNSINQKLDSIEQLLADLVSKVAPWLAPVPTAYLVGRATVAHLAWPMPVAIIAALIIEALGLAATSTALTLRDYNATKRKSDPGAPVTLSLFLVGVYLFVALALTVALDVLPQFARYAPAIFPVLSVTGMTVLAIRSDHSRRLAGIASVKAERRAKRQAKRATARAQQVQQKNATGAQQTDATGAQQQQSSGASGGATSGVLGAANEAKRRNKEQALDALLAAYEANPQLGATEAGALLGVHRNSIYRYADELEQSGRIKRNGQGVVVLGGEQ